MSRLYQIATAGSHGDVLPFMALAEALAKRGHTVLVYGTPLFAQFAPANVRFVGVGTDALYYEILGLFNEKQPLKAMRDITLVMTQVIDLLLQAMQQDKRPESVVIGGVMNPAPHLFAEKFQLPLVNIHLSPLAIYSTQALGRALPILDGLLRLNSPFLNKCFWRWADFAIFRRSFTRPINKVRQRHGLAPLMMPMVDWINQSDVLLGFFDEVFAPRQSDWLPKLQLVGFPFYEQGLDLSPQIQAFLQKGEAPVLFCAGTASANAADFFATSVAACQRLGIRGIVVSHIAKQLPSTLPANILALDYVSYAAILPHVAAFVHHGGIGNTAIALKTATPQLIRPTAFDQFDNALRLRQLGVGIEILPKDYQVEAVVKGLNTLLNHQGMRQRCQEIAAQIRHDALQLACEAIEALPNGFA